MPDTTNLSDEYTALAIAKATERAAGLAGDLRALAKVVEEHPELAAALRGNFDTVTTIPGAYGIDVAAVHAMFQTVASITDNGEERVYLDKRYAVSHAAFSGGCVHVRILDQIGGAQS